MVRNSSTASPVRPAASSTFAFSIRASAPMRSAREEARDSRVSSARAVSPAAA